MNDGEIERLYGRTYCMRASPPAVKITIV